jgi:hypothetical protein
MSPDAGQGMGADSSTSRPSRSTVMLTWLPGRSRISAS